MYLDNGLLCHGLVVNQLQHSALLWSSQLFIGSKQDASEDVTTHWPKNIPSKPLTLDLMETLDLFFRRACYHWNVSHRKIKRIKVVDLQIRFCSFLYLTHPKKLQNLQKKSPKFA